MVSSRLLWDMKCAITPKLCLRFVVDVSTIYQRIINDKSEELWTSSSLHNRITAACPVKLAPNFLGGLHLNTLLKTVNVFPYESIVGGQTKQEIKLRRL
uniref:Uncharacterized protein n=1 Tax=Romanomermis culicivorax TaxID=13658 RepID=A0A915II05_ROMCU